MKAESISIVEARRIALAAQGFGHPRPTGPVGPRHIRRVLGTLGLLQLDYVNVVLPAHYQVLFSRLGPYRTSLLHDLAYRRREFTEQWAHEACLVPVVIWPLLRHRMERYRVRPYGFESFLDQHPAYVQWVLDEVRARGPLAADALGVPEGVDRRFGSDWFWTVPKATLEAHFGRGLLAVASRREDCTRVYDLAERVIAQEHRERIVDRLEAQRSLLLLAARACGVGTAADLADYYRMPVREAHPRIAELVETGELREVRVEGWRGPAYLHAKAPSPRPLRAAALLSPFDPVVWFRPRAARLFDFDYRFEIFVPRTKRRWGCYVLPFLLGERLSARVDLKADRAGRCLNVVSAQLEPHARPGPTAEALADELATLSRWLGLESIAVRGRRDFNRALACALRARGVLGRRTTASEGR